MVYGSASYDDDDSDVSDDDDNDYDNDDDEDNSNDDDGDVLKFDTFQSISLKL